MSCNNPRNAWMPDDGGGLLFKWSAGIELYAKHVQVPCRNKCEGCLADRKRNTVAGLYCHSLTAEFPPLFCTWTVDENHLIGDGLPHKERLQKLFKSMRKAGCEFDHFSVAEFGDKTGREHFHSIIFPKSDWYPLGNYGDPLSHKARGLKFNTGMNGYIDSFFSDLWKHGFTFTAPVNTARLSYVAGYCGKKMGGRTERPMASKYLGVKALEQFGAEWLRDGYVNVRGSNGKFQKFPVPKRFAAYEPDGFEALKERRREFAEARPARSDAQLAAREELVIARNNLRTVGSAHPRLKRARR